MAANTKRSPSRDLSPPKRNFEKENEERYAWLVDVKDADGHPVGHPDYDPRTLYIPKSAWAKFTPFEKQYWEVKQKMWNTVVFFKKGKFYELYEPDAEIAHERFDLKLAGGGRANMRLAGIPEMSFDYWAGQFISAGYKVAKVDQAETSLGKEMRDAATGKKEDKIIKRELKCVLTGGTLTDEGMLVDDLSTFCMAIKQDGARFAVCFVDTATGAFQVAEINDDVDYSQFETLIAQLRPRELVLERGNLTAGANKILKNNTSVDTIWNVLKPRAEFWDADTAHEELVNARYFAAEDLDDLSAFPQVLRDAIEGPKPLLLSAFGGLMWYLRSLKLDATLVSMGNFGSYDAVRAGRSLVLDGQSLQNLEVFANTFDGSDEGTLFRLLNRCTTPFGKRRLRAWTAHPLTDVAEINARLDTVDFFNGVGADVRDHLEAGLAGLPDLERLLSRIHSGALRPKDFARVISGFEKIFGLVENVQGNHTELLDRLLNSVPALQETLATWSTAFDRARAATEDVLIPEPGVEDEFDASQQGIQAIEDELQTRLREYRREFKSMEIHYRDSGKEIYLIEVPAKIKSVPRDWQQMGATSKVKRYYSPEVRTLVRQLQEAKETHKAISAEIQGRLYKRFDARYLDWLQAVHVVAQLDCLLSLAKTSRMLGAPNCRPKFVDDERSVLDFKELRHPTYMGTRDFIPNDIRLGGDGSNITLLTGANAAGKSTVLRMSCVAAIMAQMGCYVPCREATLTPVDRVMTRLGANDNIFAGKSTFYVELSETQRILSEATNRSLIVLDELGRGGSSSDGFAIAEAVLHHLATYTGSLGFFATHYATLSQSFDHHPEIRPQRMAILVDDASRKVTFLYKLEEGVSPGSFGMHVAAMCGVDKSIVERAAEAAQKFEHTARMRKLLEFNRDEVMLPVGVMSDFSHFAHTDTPVKPCDEPQLSRAVSTVKHTVNAL